MFYIIERKDQLSQLGPFNDCFVQFIQQNDNYHPKLSSLSLVYVRDITQHKGYILCINHSESFSLTQHETLNWLLKNTNRLFVLNKKEALYHFPHPDKLYDINFIENVDLSVINNNCINYYYRKHNNLPNINCLVPISKHYENCENIFTTILHVFRKYSAENTVYAFNNGPLTRVFHEIESQGITVNKQCFIDCYGADLKNPEFNISKGKIYSQYNLYTTTGRPSNTYNSINFAALNKTNGERLCYRPANDMFVEFDIQGYHPRLIAEMIDFNFLNTRSVYETLATVLNVTTQEAKELTFKQLYGGVWDEYQNKPFFKDIVTLTDGIWNDYQYSGQYSTKNKIFMLDKDMTQSKLLNYIIQSNETSTNVTILEKILDYLKDKQTKLVLYTYDAFLFDYNKEDSKQVLVDIANLIKYPVNIKQGTSYHELNKI